MSLRSGLQTAIKLGEALEVTTVTAGGRAAQAGIVPGGKITAMQGCTIARGTNTGSETVL